MVTVISLKQDLAINYSDVMAIPLEDVLNILKTLQENANEKLAARSRFQKEGLATVRVKVVGTQQVQDVVINLKKTGQYLRDMILQTMTFSSRLKLICNGIILRDDVTLEDQRVSNSSQILALSFSSDEETQRVS
jgi:Ubiquitin-like domain